MTKKKERENYTDMSVDELIEKWRQVKGLLDSLEDDYRKAEISESAYKEAKQKNEKKFKQLTEILAGWGITDDQLQAKAPVDGEEGSDSESVTSEAKPAADPSVGKASPAQPTNQAPTQPAPAQAPPTAAQPAPAAAAAQPAVAAPVVAVAQPPAQPSISMETIEAKIDGKTQKLSANIDTLKETNSGMSERMQTINESIGELRSHGSQRESVIKDMQSKLDTIDDEVSAINPQKYSKALEKRDKTAGKQDMRIEKLEMKASDIAKTTGEIRKLLESIGGLENISNVSKDIGKKMNHVTQLYDDMQKLANRIEKIYVQLNKRMEDFAIYKSKQENVEGVVKDIIKSIDAVSVRLDDYVTIPNFDSLKKGISDLEIRINTLQEMIGKVIPVARMKIPQPIRDLQEEKEAIQSINDSLESEYAEGRMAKESYDLVREKNIKKMGSVETALKKEWNRFERLVVGSQKVVNVSEPNEGQIEPKPEEGSKPEKKPNPEGEIEPEEKPRPEGETAPEDNPNPEERPKQQAGQATEKTEEKPSVAGAEELPQAKSEKPMEIKPKKPIESKPITKPVEKETSMKTMKVMKPSKPAVNKEPAQQHKPTKPSKQTKHNKVTEPKKPRAITKQPAKKPGRKQTKAKAVRKPVKPKKKAVKKAVRKKAVAKKHLKPSRTTKPTETSKHSKSEVSASMLAMNKMESGAKMEKEKAAKPKAESLGKEVQPVKKEAKSAEPAKPANEKEAMLAALEDSHKRGLISKEAYEKTKNMLEGK